MHEVDVVDVHNLDLVNNRKVNRSYFLVIYVTVSILRAELNQTIRDPYSTGEFSLINTD